MYDAIVIGARCAGAPAAMLLARKGYQVLLLDEKRRNEASATGYQRNIDFARFKPLPPETYQLRAALRGNQEDTNRFIMASEGMIPREEFFNPENVRRITVAAGSAVQTRFA
jgi:flavin-dependent dehydrogenase